MLVKDLLSLTNGDITKQITVSKAKNDDILIVIDKSLKDNRIIISYCDKEPEKQEESSVETKSARLRGAAKAYYQYMANHVSFSYYDIDADRYANKHMDRNLFKRAVKICDNIYEVKLGISPSVFVGITSVVIDKGYENRVIDGVSEIVYTFSKIKNGSLPLIELKNGDPICEFCLYLARRGVSTRSNVAREISAKITCAFWNAYLKDGKIDGFHRIAEKAPFAPLLCCPRPCLADGTA